MGDGVCDGVAKCDGVRHASVPVAGDGQAEFTVAEFLLNGFVCSETAGDDAEVFALRDHVSKLLVCNGLSLQWLRSRPSYPMASVPGP